MLISTHIATEYILSEIYINNFNLQGVDSLLITTFTIVGSLVSDIDGLSGSQMKDHRKTPFHAPLIWFSFILIILLFGIFTFNEKMMIYNIMFGFGIFFHLFLDWLGGRTTGIRIFYPFSQKQYSLFRHDSQKGAISMFPNRKNIRKYFEFVKFYFKNKILVTIEIIINLFAILIWVM